MKEWAEGGVAAVLVEEITQHFLKQHVVVEFANVLMCVWLLCSSLYIMLNSASS